MKLLSIFFLFIMVLLLFPGCPVVFINELDPQIPTAPGNLTATVISNSSIGLSWDDNSDAEDNFTLQWDVAADFSSFSEAVLSADSDTYIVDKLNTDTEYFFRIRAGNSFGNNSSWSDVSSAITSTVPPSGTFSINNNEVLTNAPAVTLNSNITDAAEMRFRNGTDSWIDWETYSAARGWNLNSGDGTKTVGAEYRNSLGITINESDSIELDTVEPVINSFSINNDESITDSLNVTLYSNVSGAEEMSFSNEGSSWSEWFTYAAEKSWVLESPAGENTVYAKYRDAAGNLTDGLNYDTIIMVDAAVPTAVLDLADEQGRTVSDGLITYGNGFILQGKRSVDFDGEIVEWRFTRLSGTGGELPEPDTGYGTLPGMTVGETVYSPSSILTIQLPDDKFDKGPHIFQLQVVDDSGNVSQPVQITMIVFDSQAPTAVLDLADEQGRTITDGRVPYGSGFILQGKRSVDIGGEIVEWRFTRLSGTGGELPEPNTGYGTLPGMTVGETVYNPSSILTIQLPNDKFDTGRHDFQLQVVDDSGNVSTPAKMTIIVADRTAPTAVLVANDLSGQQLADSSVGYGEGFILDGSRSVDIGGAISKYTWKRDGDTMVETSVPTWTVNDILPVGHYVYELIVKDDSGNVSTPAKMTIIVADRSAPTAVLDANDLNGQLLLNNTIGYGKGFILDGSRSVDIGGEISKYTWKRDGDTMVETSVPTWTVNDVLPVGNYLYELYVNDDSGNVSQPAAVTIVVADTKAPTAVLRVLDSRGSPLVDNTLASGKTFILDGSDSFDSGGGVIARYIWTQDDTRPIITTTSSLRVTEVLPVGSYLLELVVQDNSNNYSSPALITLKVIK